MGDNNFTLTRTGNGVRAEKSLHNGLHIQGIPGRLELSGERDDPTGEHVRSIAPAADAGMGGRQCRPRWTRMIPASPFMAERSGTAAPRAIRSPCRISTRTRRICFFFPRTPKSEYREGDSNVVWAADTIEFFTMLAMPLTNEPAAQVVPNPVYLPPFSGVEAAPGTPLLEGIQTALDYGANPRH